MYLSVARVTVFYKCLYVLKSYMKILGVFFYSSDLVWIFWYLWVRQCRSVKVLIFFCRCPGVGPLMPAARCSVWPCLGPCVRPLRWCWRTLQCPVPLVAGCTCVCVCGGRVAEGGRRKPLCPGRQAHPKCRTTSLETRNTIVHSLKRVLVSTWTSQITVILGKISI